MPATSPLQALEFRKVHEHETARVIEELSNAGLPVADISDKVTLFGLFESENTLAAIAGLEMYGHDGLLRSVCVPASMQGRGYGKQVVNELERYGREVSIHSLYLLTTTASDFFIKAGYHLADRSTAPLAIQQTAEFAGLCPSTAAFMCKNLTEG